MSLNYAPKPYIIGLSKGIYVLVLNPSVGVRVWRAINELLRSVSRVLADVASRTVGLGFRA